MDRIIQPYPGPGAPSRLAPASPAPLPAMTLPGKSPADFARAVRRRWPLVLVVAVVVTSAGAAYVVRMPAVYKATAQIMIEPPRFDSHLAIILSNGQVPPVDRESSERYVPNRIARLTGRAMAEEVVARSDLGLGKGYEGDPAAEILNGMTSRRLQTGTNIFEVALEGADPTRITKLLEFHLGYFADKIFDESSRELDKSKTWASEGLKQHRKELAELDEKIDAQIRETPHFAPGGRNILQDDYAAIKSLILTKKARFDDLRHEERIAQLWPGLKGAGPPSKYSRKIEALLEQKDRLEGLLEDSLRVVRNPGSDAATRYFTKSLDKVLDDLERLTKLDVSPDLPDRSALILAHSSEEIRKLERELKDLLDQVQANMPAYQKYQSLMRERDQKEASLADMQKRLTQFQMVAESKSRPVEILLKPTEPGGPVRPNRPMLIALSAFFGLALGVGLVCVREYLDRSVKVPEHLVAGLSLPLVGVVPRIRRLARTQRAGHLWTHGDPLSIEADAYRNLRASLVGLTGPNGPVVSVLVTSAKAGEGKSTTALNLATTCARAGERVLLIDVDLRRPSLAEVFDAQEPNVGLVDVLRGDMPWPQAVIRTDVPNLNFLPAGDPTGVPVEVLGTLELRQLLKAVTGQYHRVILDGPAVLGLADCRMLGRVVDAAILVVRCGAHEIRPLRRAKEMLEQSRVPVAGVVFNGLSEDIDNWASEYGAPALPNRATPRSDAASRGLPASPEPAVAGSDGP